MSYVRWGSDGSDVYVFLTDGYLECCACEEPGHNATSTDEMIAHLRAHQARGECVPDWAFEGLEADRDDNDVYLAGGLAPPLWYLSTNLPPSPWPGLRVRLEDRDTREIIVWDGAAWVPELSEASS